MLSSFKLPIRFDPKLLQRDFAALQSDQFVRHFNQQQYSGDWSVLPLRAVPNSHVAGYSDPMKTGQFENTSFLDNSPYLQEVINSFSPIRGTDSVQSARLLRLGPGAIITRHRDYNIGMDFGEIRLHVPIVTNPQVEFYVNDEPLTMLPGECWYADFGLPHSVANHGETERVHLVLDCVVNRHILSFFPKDWEESILPSHAAADGIR